MTDRRPAAGWRRWIVALGAAGLTAMALPTAARAHLGGSTGYAAITVHDNAIRYSLTLSPPGLPAAIVDELVRARSGNAASRDRLIAAVRDKVRLDADGRRCEPAQGFVEAPAADAESLTVAVDFACASAVGELFIRDDLFDVLGPDHHALAKVQWPGGVRQLAFEPAAREGRVTIGARASAHGDAGFFRLGVEHILTGYDHLLFLAALLLRGGRLGSLLGIITAFTIAHSITLALAVTGLIAVSPRVVEPVIAASIVWVAVENVVLRIAPAHRWRVAFVFGLIHGFGFASMLTPLSLPAGGLAWALFAFNAGVEVGQALVVLILLPVIAWMRGRPWERAVVRAASLGVAALGLVWLVERLVGE